MSRDYRTRTVAGARALLTAALILTLTFSSVFLAPRRASAIPAFARKYQTSCATCHVAPPALTPFGEAFRQNGYRFPEGQDASMTKDQPVELGAEGYKKMWPHSVWPGQIPGMPPIAVLYTSAMEFDNATNVTTFEGMGGELEILAAGTLDEHLSFWGSIVAAREGEEIALEMERVNLQVRPFQSPVVQFKIGAFEPGIMLESTHRSIMDQELLALTEPAGDNPWAPEPFQQGIEATGIVHHRVLYNAGVVEGSGSLGDKTKDGYARLAYKAGGLAFDGVSSNDGQGASNPKPWSEKSIAVSAFGYDGTSYLSGDAENPGPTDRFQEFGGDVVVQFLDAKAHAGYTDRKDKRLLLDDPTLKDAHVKNTFAEMYWVVLPWLTPSARWEQVKVIDEKTQQWSFTINGLVRANVKTFLAANWVKEPEGKLINEGGTLGVLIGF